MDQMTVTEFIVQTAGVCDHLLVRILEVEVSKKLQIQRLNRLGSGRDFGLARCLHGNRGNEMLRCGETGYPQARLRPGTLHDHMLERCFILLGLGN